MVGGDVQIGMLFGFDGLLLVLMLILVLVVDVGVSIGVDYVNELGGLDGMDRLWWNE